MSARERGENRVFVDDTLSRAGIDLWGAAANAAAFTLAPALPTAISLLARIDPQALGRLEHGDAGAYRTEYKRLNARLDAAADGLTRFATYYNYDRLHGELDWHTPAERYDGTPFTARGFERVPALDHLQGWLAELMPV